MENEKQILSSTKTLSSSADLLEPYCKANLTVDNASIINSTLVPYGTNSALTANYPGNWWIGIDSQHTGNTTNIATYHMYDYSGDEYKPAKLIEIEQLDGTKTIVKFRPADLLDIKECIDEKKKFVFKLPFPGYVTTKTTYVKFFNSFDKKEYTVKCSLPAFMKAVGLTYTSFGELIFDNALAGIS